MTTKNILSIIILIFWIIGVILVGTESIKILIGITMLMWTDNISKIINKM